MARAANYAIAAVVTLLVSSSVAGAVEWRSWCGAPGEGPSLGWHFYCDRPEEPPVAQPAPVPAAPDTRSATERIREMRRELEEARATAILDPTTQNVAAYLRLQQETLQRAAVFSDAFRRTVWATPDVDYTLKRPVGALAKRLWSDERRQARDRALADLGERYGLIYLGHAGCAGCRVFGPAPARLQLPSRARRAGRLHDRRGAGGLARGGAGQRARRQARPRRGAGAGPWCCSTRRRNRCCRSASA